jgi:branched-subunit amino acid transport protein AzlD
MIDGREKVILNIYCINKNNLYDCPHVQPDIVRETLVAVLDTGANISLLLEIFLGSVLRRA